MYDAWSQQNRLRPASAALPCTSSPAAASRWQQGYYDREKVDAVQAEVQAVIASTESMLGRGDDGGGGGGDEGVSNVVLSCTELRWLHRCLKRTLPLLRLHDSMVSGQRNDLRAASAENERLRAGDAVLRDELSRLTEREAHGSGGGGGGGGGTVSSDRGPSAGDSWGAATGSSSALRATLQPRPTTAPLARPRGVSAAGGETRAGAAALPHNRRPGAAAVATATATAPPPPRYCTPGYILAMPGSESYTAKRPSSGVAAPTAAEAATAAARPPPLARPQTPLLATADVAREPSSAQLEALPLSTPVSPAADGGGLRWRRMVAGVRERVAEQPATLADVVAAQAIGGVGTTVLDVVAAGGSDVPAALDSFEARGFGCVAERLRGMLSADGAAGGGGDGGVSIQIHDEPGRGAVEILRSKAEQDTVTVSASSQAGGCSPVETVLQDPRRAPALVRPYFLTQDRPGAYVEVRLHAAVLRPHAYTLESVHPIFSGYHLRSWQLLGSLDGGEWVLLREHTRDESLRKGASSCTWDLPWPPVSGAEAAKTDGDADGDGAGGGERAPFFNRFRLAATGKNALGTNALQLSGFELHGRLVHAERARCRALMAPAGVGAAGRREGAEGSDAVPRGEPPGDVPPAPAVQKKKKKKK